MTDQRSITVTINSAKYTKNALVRMTLPDFLRSELGLTGTHLGCEHGVCGACTILLDGRSARSCLMLAVEADGHEITTIEGIAPAPDKLHPLQEAFRDNHGQQCGFCTPGMLTTLLELLRTTPNLPSRKCGGDLGISAVVQISRHHVGGARRRQAPEGAGLARRHLIISRSFIGDSGTGQFAH